MNIGIIIGQLREKKGVSIEQLSSVLEVPSSFIEKIEDGKIDPTFGTVQRIFKTLKEPLMPLIDQIIEEGDSKFNIHSLKDILDIAKKNRHNPPNYGIVQDFKREMTLYLSKVDKSKLLEEKVELMEIAERELKGKANPSFKGTIPKDLILLHSGLEHIFGYLLNEEMYEKLDLLKEYKAWK